MRTRITSNTDTFLRSLVTLISILVKSLLYDYTVFFGFFFLGGGHKFKKDEAQENIARLTLTNITGKINFLIL